MFYVAKGKVYSTEFDAERKVYPEMRIVRDDDVLSLRKLPTGGSEGKPKDRQLCTLEEVFAQLGATASEIKPDLKTKSKE